MPSYAQIFQVTPCNALVWVRSVTEVCGMLYTAGPRLRNAGCVTSAIHSVDLSHRPASFLSGPLLFGTHFWWQLLCVRGLSKMLIDVGGELHLVYKLRYCTPGFLWSKGNHAILKLMKNVASVSYHIRVATDDSQIDVHVHVSGE